MWYLMIVTMLVRFKYYHAWIFADAICNNSGLGFNGYDENGEANWNLYSNVNVVGFEVALLNINEPVSDSTAVETGDFNRCFGSARP